MMASGRARVALDCRASCSSSMACRKVCTSKKSGSVGRSTVASSRAKGEPLVLHSC